MKRSTKLIVVFAAIGAVVFLLAKKAQAEQVAQETEAESDAVENDLANSFAGSPTQIIVSPPPTATPPNSGVVPPDDPFVPTLQRVPLSAREPLPRSVSPATPAVTVQEQPSGTRTKRSFSR